MSSHTHPQSALGEALFEHDADRVTSLAQAGARLRDGENAVELIATGLSVEYLDDRHSQHSEPMGETLTAARNSGLDLNKPIDGKATAIWLTEHYAYRHAGYAFDMSELGQNGAIEDTTMARLKTFAMGGVDFSVRDEKGQGFQSVADDAVRQYAKDHKAFVLKPGYTPEEDWDEPTLETVQSNMQSQLQDMKRDMRIMSVLQVAQDKAHAVRAAKMKKSPRYERDCPF